MSDDRKYRHRGYMDGGREETPRGPRIDEPRASSIPGAPRGRSAGNEKNLVVVCKQCGQKIADIAAIEASSTCSRCGTPLHSCRQCRFFDSSARWECSANAKIPAPVPSKSSANTCPVYAPAASFDLTGTKAADSPADARKAFEALFKK